MRTKILLTIIAFVFSGLAVVAQSDFETEMVTLHKNAIKNCGMIKSPGNHDSAKIVESLGKLKAEIAADEAKYTKDRPAGYEKDPLFASYFEELDDVVDALITRVQKNNYKRAAMNCSRICMVFNKMHMFNGKTDLTDMMFNWNMQITFTMNMLNAGNENGAYQNMKKVKMVYSKMITFKDKKEDSVFQEQFKNVDEIYKKWEAAMNEKNVEQAKSLFNEFNNSFRMPFMLSL